MKKGLDLVSLAQQIEDNRSAKQDFIVPSRELMMTIEEGEQGRPSPYLVVPGEGEYPIRPIAHDQLGGYTEIPAKYYDRMLNSSPQLLADNVNHWFRNSPAKDKRMVRTLRGYHRSLLSNRYQRIENEEIAEVSLPILLNTPGVSPVSTEVTERRLYIQATTDRVVGEVKKGDVVQAGLIISNSETGHGSVSVKAMFYRLMCLNGMILPTAFRANHIGRRIDDNEDLYRDDTRAADDKAVLLKVRDTVTAFLSHDFFNKKLSEMQALTEGEITGKVDKAVEVLSAKIGANDGEREGILQSLIKGGDLSRWGVLNAVTHQAHSVKDYDRSVEFEGMGGKLLELPKHEWKEILEAA
jgi:hypothetical protein